MTVLPSLNEVLKLSKNYNLIPIYHEILADLETPISAFMKINKDKYAFLLDSVEGGEQIARYSFLGSNPYLIFQAKNNQCKIIKNIDQTEYFESDDPIKTLKNYLSKYKPYQPPSLPYFYGGAVGYFSYDSVRYIERIPNNNDDDLDLPHLSFMFTDSIIIFDHVEHKIKIVYNLNIKQNKIKSVESAYQKGVEHIKSKLKLLKTPIKIKESITNPSPQPVNANISEDKFKEAVIKAKEYIVKGDIFQVQISRRLSINLNNINHFNIYRALRAINPSPYMFYLKFDNIEVIGSSPELLVRKNKNRVVVRPIAGTRRRGRTMEDERNMENELKNDEKEKAEHIMLVDLGRNDIARVCKYGSVRLTKENNKQKLMYCEKYSHVMHLVSEVEGIMFDDKDAFDAFKACFPAGTLTGAPKIRAMEIIEELEPTKRGLYGGGVAYFSFNGDMDSCIIIRTAVIKNNIAYVQTAGGIVYDSKPELEFLEAENKAKALIKAIEYAKTI